MIESEKKNRLQYDMNIAVEKIRSSFSDGLVAIYLVGGYGRGEGAWFYDENNVLQPYNDYDFVVICKKPLSRKEYNELRQEISKAVQIRWVDINFYRPYYFRFANSTIKNIDSIYASFHLYGDDVLKKKKLNPKKIGVYDIITLYMTRIWTFLGSWEGEFRNQNLYESRFFLNQMAKATLAACDMLLIRSKEYTPSYKARIDKVINLYRFDIKESQLIKWAYKEKTAPSDKCISESEMKELYWRVKHFFINSLKLSSPDFFKSLVSLKTTRLYILKHGGFLIPLLKEKMRKGFSSSKSIKEIDIFFAQHLIFIANDKGKINYSILEEANDILKKYGYLTTNENDWNSIRIIVAEARNNI